MEMGIGFQRIKLVQEETDPMVNKTLRKMVEDQTPAQMHVQKKMQMQRQQSEGGTAGRIGGEQMGGDAPVRQGSEGRNSSEAFP